MKSKSLLLLPLTFLLSLTSCQTGFKSNLKYVVKSKVNKIRNENYLNISQTTYDSYYEFAKTFASLSFNKQEKEESFGVSIPDAYICLSIIAVISTEKAQKEVLDFLNLSSLEELKTAVKEIVATLATLEKVDNKHSSDNGKLFGGFNLNSIWFDPLQVELKDKDPELYSDLANLFDASIINEALTTKGANDYLKENGLADLPTPEVELDDSNPSALSVMSAYYCMDHFGDYKTENYKKQYQSGNHKINYFVNNKEEMVDYIKTTDYSNVYLGDSFVGAPMKINRLNVDYFLPNEKELMPSAIVDDVLKDNYVFKTGLAKSQKDENETLETTEHRVTIKAPYFSIDNKIELDSVSLHDYLPLLTGERCGLGERLVTPKASEMLPDPYLFLDKIQQFSTMRFNYDGFYSSSVTIASMVYGSAGSLWIHPTFQLDLTHPYLFKVQKNVRVDNNSEFKKLPLVIGEIVEPNYRD